MNSTFEEKRSKCNALVLFDNNLLLQWEAGTAHTLAKIHRHLFTGVFEFAGEWRMVNIAKGNFRFASARYLERVLKDIDAMPIHNFDEIIDKYVEMNIAHPFREGNGRSMRLWLNGMLHHTLHQVVSWQQIERTAYLTAMTYSPYNAQPLKKLLHTALTEEGNNRLRFMRDLDASYTYEEMTTYRTESLDKSECGHK